MFGNGRAKMNPADYFLDESVPMPLPRFAQNPQPFNMEMPKLTVPDLSLLVHSPHTPSFINNSYGPTGSTPSCNNSHTRKTSIQKSQTRFPDTPSEVGNGSPYYKNHRMTNRSGQQMSSAIIPQTSPSGNSSSPKDNAIIQHLVELGKGQSVAIEKMQEQIDILAKPKENTIMQQLIGLVKTQSVAIEKMQEQIDLLIKSKDNCNNGHISSRSSTPSSASKTNKNMKVSAEKEVQVNLPVPDSRRPSPEIKSNKIKMINFACQTEVERKIEVERSGGGMSDENTSQQDVSRFLRDVSLRLPQIEENTIYSADTSGIRLIDMPEYDEEEDSDNNSNSPHLGPSISAYASSDEENECDERELEYPADQRVTHRPRHPCPAPRQILQKQRPPPQPQPRSTDSTLYGLSSKHLSFSTKQYLERYGLVHPGGNGIPAPAPKLFMGHGSPNRSRDTSTSDRILDITALKNQPKLA